jgi:opacity protein-like surface antigen
MDRSVGDGGFFYSLGTGLEYQLNDNCKLTANVEYLYGIISFHTLRHITQYNSTLGVTHQTFKAINATIGLSFLLRRK